MWFKNLQIFRLPAPWRTSAAELETQLAKMSFEPGTSLDMKSIGWIPPRHEGQLVHAVGRNYFLTLCTEKKLLPASVIKQVANERAAELEEQQGFRPGRKQMKDLRDQVADELLPRAFAVRSTTRVWIDAQNGWLGVDSSSPSKVDDVVKMLLKSIDSLPIESLQTQRSPGSAMTDWLASGEAPYGFTVDQDTELRASSESKATVRYVRHSLESDDVRRHIESGKQCTRLAMTWSDRVSFVLTDSLVLKQIKPLDVLNESADKTAQNEDEEYDADMTLMASELHGLLTALIESLGGQSEGGDDSGD